MPSASKLCWQPMCPWLLNNWEPTCYSWKQAPVTKNAKRNSGIHPIQLRLSSACLISWKCSVAWAACLYREIRTTLHEIIRQRRPELVKVCFSLRNLAPILSSCAHDEPCGKNTLLITQIIKSTKENWNWEHFLNIFFYFLSRFYILHKFSHSSQRMLSFEIEWIL